MCPRPASGTEPGDWRAGYLGLSPGTRPHRLAAGPLSGRPLRLSYWLALMGSFGPNLRGWRVEMIERDDWTRGMCMRIAALATMLACCASTALASDETAGAEPIDFARDIGPIFVEHCYVCHGPDVQESGLRLDQRDAALAGGDSGPLFIAGAGSESELIRRVTADEDERMPPAEDNNKPLSQDEIEKLTAWIDAGGSWPETAAAGTSHWSFQPIVRPVPQSSRPDRRR